MTPPKLGLSIAVVAAIATAVYVSQRRHAPEGAAAAPAAAASAGAPAQPVGVVRASQRDVPIVIEAAGSVVPIRTVDLRPQVASTVRRIAFKEGAFVHQGDLLFTLDDRVDRSGVERARSQMARDQATLADARRQLQRAQDLLAQKFISQSALDAASTAVDAASASVRADAGALRSAETALSYDTLRAPISGRAGALSVNLGSLVQPTAAALVTISQIDPIAVAFTVPEAQVDALLQGLKAGIPVAVRPTGTSGTPAEPLQGRLAFVDNQIDASTGTIRAKAELPNPKQLLWPGQYVTARIQLRTLAGAIVIPQAAVIQRGNERGVYIAGGDDVVQWRPVRTRYAFGDRVVVDGVQADERVVVDGKQNLRPGDRIVEALGASGAASAASAAGAPASAGATR